MTSCTRFVAAAALAALIAGCSGADTTNTGTNDAVVSENAALPVPTPQPSATPLAEASAAAADAPSLAIDGDGLRWVDAESGSTRAIPFGIPRAAALEALSTLGKPTLGTDEECSMPYAAFANGLTINFEEGKFAGWSLDRSKKPTLSTMSGVAIGSTLAEMREANEVKVEESSIGQEFLIGEVAGLLDGNKPASKVTDLWSGVVCIAR